jgi:hypothetical protein
MLKHVAYNFEARGVSAPTPAHSQEGEGEFVAGTTEFAIRAKTFDPWGARHS